MCQLNTHTEGCFWVFHTYSRSSHSWLGCVLGSHSCIVWEFGQRETGSGHATSDARMMTREMHTSTDMQMFALKRQNTASRRQYIASSLLMLACVPWNREFRTLREVMRIHARGLFWFNLCRVLWATQITKRAACDVMIEDRRDRNHALGGPR